MTAPLPGDYGVVRTSGWAARLIQLVTRSSYNHAFVYVGDGKVVEGRPAGAGYADLSSYPDVLWGVAPLTLQQREVIVAAAVDYIGVGYSWADCVAIGLTDLFGWRTPQFIIDRLNRVRLNRARPGSPASKPRDRLMCSALVDTCYLDAGVHLFHDGRVPGSVAPSDLADLATGATS